MKTRILGVLLLVLTSVALLSGTMTIHADGGGGDTPTPTAPYVPPPFVPTPVTGLGGTTSTSTGPGQVRFIHVSPGTPNLDFYISSMGTPLITNLAYGGATGFLTLPSATYILTVRLTGTAVNSIPLFTHELILAPDSALNVVAIGLMNRQGSRGFLLMFVPANFEPNVGNFARMQYIHASPSYGTVNVAVNGVPTLQDFLYGDGLFTGFDYIPGTYTFTITPSKNDTGIIVLNLPNVALQANTLYTILDFGLADSIHSMVLADPLPVFKPFVPVPVQP